MRDYLTRLLRQRLGPDCAQEVACGSASPLVRINGAHIRKVSPRPPSGLPDRPRRTHQLSAGPCATFLPKVLLPPQPAAGKGTLGKA